jgi:hypothetical protein
MGRGLLIEASLPLPSASWLLPLLLFAFMI